MKVAQIFWSRSVPARSRESSFETQLLAELPVLYRVALRLTRSSASAEDLASQTVFKALTSQDQFEGKYLRSWLIQIMNRTFWRESSQSDTLNREPLDKNLPCEDNVFSTVYGKIFSQELINQLDLLPKEYGIAVVLCDMEGMSYEEASRALSVPIGTVRSRLYRGRRILRDRLAPLLETTDV